MEMFYLQILGILQYVGKKVVESFLWLAGAE